MTIFSQFNNDFIYEAWEWYKEIVRKVPNHGLLSWLKIQFFYNRLNPNTKMTIDAAAGGALISKDEDEAREQLEEMVSNNYLWQSERVAQKKITDIYELDTLSTIQAQLL